AGYLSKLFERLAPFGHGNRNAFDREAAMKKSWGVHLRGHPFDLKDWAEALRSPFDPWVEEKDGQYYLRTAQFDDLTDAEGVQGLAKTIVEPLNAAMEIQKGS